MMLVFIVTVDCNRGEEVTREEIREKLQEGLYDSTVTVKEIV